MCFMIKKFFSSFVPAVVALLSKVGGELFMLENFFSSAWPTVVALCVGAVTFLVGNFFGHYLPEGWLVPLAWCSSMTLCLGLVLGSVAYAIRTEPWFMTGPALLMAGGFVCGMIWFILELFGEVNYDFVNTDIFSHPVAGMISIGIMAIGASIMVVPGAKGWWPRLFAVTVGSFLLCFGVVIGASLWVLPLSEKVISIIGGVGVICFLAAIVELLLALITGNIKKF